MMVWDDNDDYDNDNDNDDDDDDYNADVKGGARRKARVMARLKDCFPNINCQKLHFLYFHYLGIFSLAKTMKSVLIMNFPVKF